MDMETPFAGKGAQDSQSKAAERRRMTKRERILRELDVTHATYNGEQVSIAIPRTLNRRTAGIPITFTTVDHIEPYIPATTTAAAKKALGKHAQRFVKHVDWGKRTIVFKGKHHPRVTLPPDSDGAWKYMEALLASTCPQGWVELGKDLDARWSGNFTRRDEHRELDTKNPLTNLLCRIEANRRRGRPKNKTLKDATKTKAPMIHLVAFNKEKFDGLVKKQQGAK